MRTGPVTRGRLSVPRSPEVHGPRGQAVANLVSVWEVPPGTGAAQTIDAWRRLVEAHESTRTPSPPRTRRRGPVSSGGGPPSAPGWTCTSRSRSAGASERRLPGDLPAAPAGAVEAGLLAFARGSATAPRHLDLTPVRSVAA